MVGKVLLQYLMQFGALVDKKKDKKNLSKIGKASKLILRLIERENYIGIFIFQGTILSVSITQLAESEVSV